MKPEKKIAHICLIALICLAGCAAPSAKRSASDTGRIDTPQGMIGYLQRSKLPALRGVEVWENDYGPGLKLTTDHYEIYTTLLEPLMLKEVPGFVESAYRGYNSQLPEPIESTSKFTMYLFGERSQWEDFTKRFVGSRFAPLYLKIKAGAYYTKGVCVGYNIGRERTFSVLGHEGWHQFNSRHFKFRLPSWLDEGIAMLFETSRAEQGMFYFEPDRNGYRLATLKITLMQNKMIPLKQLISTNPGEVLATQETEVVTAFYAQAYALVRFLREDDYGKRLADYQQMLLDGLRGAWPLDSKAQRVMADRNIPLTVKWNREVSRLLFEKYISGGPDSDEIEQEYTAFCRKIVYHVRLR